MEQSEHDWEQQREQLSALLDQELDTEQRTTLEAHLASCAACHAELESLRRTRALLLALPQPTLPRSFALPIEAAPVRALPRQAAPAPTPARASKRRRPAQVLQWFSSIAAVLGILVLLSSAIVGHSISNAGTSTSALGTSQNQPASAGQPASTPTAPPERTASTHPDCPSPIPTAGPTNATPGTNQGQAVSPSSTSGATPNFGVLISSVGLGGLLLILSACGFAIAWALRRRW